MTLEQAVAYALDEHASAPADANAGTAPPGA
jgi:hypothetical protein